MLDRRLRTATIGGGAILLSAVLAAPANGSTPAAPPPAQPVGTNVLLSRALDGTPADGASSEPSLTDDGRYVAFTSGADDIFPGQTGQAGAFLRDLTTGATTFLSPSYDGSRVRGDSEGAEVSGDGKFVVFASSASNLLPGDNSGWYDVFLYDVEKAELTSISRSSTGTPGQGDSQHAAISRDGRYVAYQTEAENLLPAGQDHAITDILLYDRITGETTFVTHRAVPGTGEDAIADGPSISADGRYVAFSSSGAGLTRDDSSSRSDAFVYDRLTDKSTLVSRSASGVLANRGTYATLISADGKVIAMSSDASNLVAGDLNRHRDVFVRDLRTGTVSVVSKTSDEQPSDNDSFVTAISADGTMVLFTTSSDLTGVGAPEEVRQAYLRNRTSGTTALVTASASGQPGDEVTDKYLQLGDFSADGSLVTYGSQASNLVDHDDNGRRDVFLYRIR